MPLYVSAVPGHMAPRHGSARSTPGKVVQHVLRGRNGKGRTIPLRQPGKVWGHEFFGVTRKVDPATGEIDITWDTEAVFVISDREHAAFRKEYALLVADGALLLRTKADHEAYHEEQKAAGQKGKPEEKAPPASAATAPAMPPAASAASVAPPPARAPAAS